MIKKYSLIFVALFCFGLSGFGQVDINAINTDFTINFDTTLLGVSNGAFNGSGFQLTPTPGHLDTDAWATTGFSDGSKGFGSDNITGDHARGTNPVATGGIYGVNIGGGNRALIIRPGNNDWTPGTLTLKIDNNSGSIITSLNVSYNIIINNDAPRSNSFNFSHSIDDTSYTNQNSLDYTTAVGSDSNGYISISRNINITGINIINGASYYLRWSGNDVGGSGSRDLIGLDDIILNAQAGIPTPELQLVDDTATNQNCGYTINFGTLGSNFGTRDLTFDIHNLGSADLEINSLSITGDYTIISPLATPFTITSGNAQTVTVQFAPTANGTRNGVLTIDSNDLDEGTCVVNLTGIGVTPSPEIDIERSTGSSIPNGALANTGYSTIFASTVMGNSTSPRT